MNEEQLNRTIEFILNQQAQLTAQQIQMQADRKVRTTPEFGNCMFPTGAVDDDTGAAEPSPVMAGHDSIGYAFGQTAVVGMKKRHQPRETADGRRVNRGHGMEEAEGLRAGSWRRGERWELHRLSARPLGELSAPHLPDYDHEPAANHRVRPAGDRMAPFNRRKRY